MWKNIIQQALIIFAICFVISGLEYEWRDYIDWTNSFPVKILGWYHADPTLPIIVTVLCAIVCIFLVIRYIKLYKEYYAWYKVKYPTKETR
jgi:hypothetical protein